MMGGMFPKASEALCSVPFYKKLNKVKESLADHEG